MKTSTATAAIQPKRFRLLIIGKSGCGKTTILSKVCGENMVDAPSTARGSHNIEKEILFQENDLMVAHDSEGFEAGQSDEVEVVKNFIARRSKANNINDRLHMVWYCVEMNSRPIQHAERAFFATLWQVPVLAIVTKFDTFVQDVQQRLEEAAEEEEFDIDEEFEARAKQEASDHFDKHYKAALMALPYPPKAVAALSDAHKSKPNDSQLAELIQESMKALHVEHSISHDQLKILFASAQKADVGVKVEASIQRGLIDNYKNIDLTAPFSINRDGLIRVWNTSWSKQSDKGSHHHTIQFLSSLPDVFHCPPQLVAVIKRQLDDSPRTIGNPASLDLPEGRELSPTRRKFCRCAQMVADTTVIMKHVFLLPVKDEAKLEELLKFCSMSEVSAHIRHQIIEVFGLTERQGGVPLGEHGTLAVRLLEIVEGYPRGSWHYVGGATDFRKV